MRITRQIDDRAFNYFEKKLATDSLAILALKEKDARLLLVRAAASLVGIREIGNNGGPDVVMLQDTIGNAYHESYCMGAVQTEIAYVERKLKIISPIPASEGCWDVWQRTPKAQRVLLLPLPGAICIWRHGNTTKGHTGIVESCDGSTMYTYEANTSAGVNLNDVVVRDGGGCYRVHRSMHGTGTMKVVGFLKPF